MHTVEQRDHRVARALAAGGRNGQHHPNRQCSPNSGLTGPEVPEIAVVRHSGGNGLSCVDHRSTTHGQKPVDPLGTTYSDPLAHLWIRWIGLDATQFHMFDAGFIESGQDTLKQTAAHHGSTAVAHQYIPQPQAFQLLGCMKFRTPAKNIFRGCAI